MIQSLKPQDLVGDRSSLVLDEGGVETDEDSGVRLMRRVAHEAHAEIVLSTARGITAVTKTFLAALLEHNRSLIEEGAGGRLNVPATIAQLIVLLRERITDTALSIVREGGGTGVAAYFDTYAQQFATEMAFRMGLSLPKSFSDR